MMRPKIITRLFSNKDHRTRILTYLLYGVLVLWVTLLFVIFTR